MVVRSLQDLTRGAWVEIDRTAIRRNTMAFKQLLDPGQKLCCCVKADAYGHGAVGCAKIMAQAGADYFAVATVDEGKELREAGIHLPILVLNQPLKRAIRELVKYNLMPSVFTSDFALAYGECAAANNRIGRYHLAVETGMNRIGVPCEDVVEFRRSIDFHCGLKCDGVFTHFATAEDADGWDFNLQLRRFTEAVRALYDAGFECGRVHCDNTPATILAPDTHFHMVRAGIGLYGLQPAKSTSFFELEPAMSVRARVSRVVHPAVGEGVGYGFTYRVPRTRVQICTLPLGYADGLARSLSNRMDVLYQGKRVYQVGNICMDQCMVAIESDPAHPAPEAQIGDVMTVVGREGEDELTLDHMALVRGTINYEVACGFGMRLDKIYV